MPPGRAATDAEVQARAAQALEDLEPLLFGGDLRVLVATEGQPETRLGYLILDLGHVEGSTGERQSLIHDLAVTPEHRGRGVVEGLVRRAAQLTGQQGLLYMTGEITACNRAAMTGALRLGFTIERHQVVIGCSPEGIGPMPGRSTAPGGPGREKQLSPRDPAG